MNLALIFLIIAVIFGFLADRKLDDNPVMGVYATVISLICTVTGVLILIIERNNW